MTSGVISINNNIPFSIETISRSEDGPLIISWNSKPGITYAIDRAIGGFEVNDWEELDDSYLATEKITSYTDDDITAGAKAVFYRVRLSE